MDQRPHETEANANQRPTGDTLNQKRSRSVSTLPIMCRVDIEAIVEPQIGGGYNKAG